MPEPSPTLITPGLLRSWPLPRPDAEGDKEERGRILVVGGSREMPGTAILAGTAALRAGAGKLRFATGQSIAIALGAAVPEGRVFAMPETEQGGLAPASAGSIARLAESAQAVLIGPGLPEDDALADLVRALLPSIQCPLILDAAAFCIFLRDRQALHSLGGRVIITPHAGEMAHICGCERDEILADCAAAARRVADELQAVVALKGRETFITAPGEKIYVNRAGNVGLATSGSGDTLAGVIAGLAARGADPLQAAVWGVYLHASAGDRLAERMGLLGFLARELLAQVPPLMAELSNSPERAEANCDGG